MCLCTCSMWQGLEMPKRVFHCSPYSDRSIFHPSGVRAQACRRARCECCAPIMFAQSLGCMPQRDQDFRSVPQGLKPLHSGRTRSQIIQVILAGMAGPYAGRSMVVHSWEHCSFKSLFLVICAAEESGPYLFDEEARASIREC